MKAEIKTLINSLYSGKIDKEEFLRSYFESGLTNEKDLISLFQKGIANKDLDVIEEVLVLLSIGSFNLNLFVSDLCNLLLTDWHYKHEDIVMLLKEIKDSSTVDCLYKAAELYFEYLDYDDTYQLARKCIKVLSAIGNENAISKLWLLSKSEIPEISEYSKKELRYKDLL